MVYSLNGTLYDLDETTCAIYSEKNMDVPVIEFVHDYLLEADQRPISAEFNQFITEHFPMLQYEIDLVGDYLGCA